MKTKIKENDIIVFLVQGHECCGRVLGIGEDVIVVKWNNGNIMDVSHKQAEAFRVEEHS